MTLITDLMHFANYKQEEMDIRIRSSDTSLTMIEKEELTLIEKKRADLDQVGRAESDQAGTADHQRRERATTGKN
jgi:hypothetical protein